jgi:hypothetical protein
VVGGSITTIKCIILTKIKFYLLIKILLEHPGRIIKKLAAGKQSEFGIAFVGGGTSIISLGPHLRPRSVNKAASGPSSL